MTFFLNSQPQPAPMQGRVAPTSHIPGLLEGTLWKKRRKDFGADASFLYANRVHQEREALFADVRSRMTESDMTEIQNRRGLGKIEGVTSGPTLSQGDATEAQRLAMLEYARELASQNPESWADLDLSEEGVEARATERLRREYDEIVAITDMIPEDRVMDDFVGGFLSAIADVRQLPFLLAGGGAGGFLKVMGREALINASTEAYLLPSQYEMAERLDIQNPNAVRQIRDAALFGAAFGAGAEALGRGFQWYAGRGEVPADMLPEGMTAQQVQQFVDQTEDALLNGTPIADIDLAPPRREVIPSQRGTFSNFVGIRVGDGNPPPRDPSDPGPQPRELDEIEQTFQSQIDEIRAETGNNRLPITDYMRRQVVDPATGRKEPSGLQVRPGGKAAQELAAMGITPRTRPGLFSRNGREEFDNLVASEWEDMFPGISDAAGVSTNDYLDQEGFLRVIANELNDGPPMLRDRQRLAEVEAQFEEYQRQREELRRFVEPVPDSDDINVSQAAMNDIKDHVARTIRLSGLNDIITPSQRADMETELATRGGSVEDLLDAMDDADLAFAESNLGEPDGRPFAPRDETDLQDAVEPIARRGGPVRPDQDANAETGSGRGGQARAGSDGSREAFSDPGRATDIQRTIASDINTQIEAEGDLDVQLEIEGRTFASARAVMDYLDEGDRFSARIDLCGLGPS